ncbi:dihydroneopterin aldolase [Rhodospirillum centenum]|uniref:Dihydroneopterin aldolase/epimerase domain-containing protein n=1 Tax=Rhodospirillum centenum (strain ATCC 51521 / SW) TaxID=414684 RepID=B6IT94_RHOCS|nr:dihydroneopterin aldolase [Rhodospirillum centenum]ACI98852.1 hypothetical protein RC1_1448 [Rhodospirillum centenum SW]
MSHLRILVNGVASHLRLAPAETAVPVLVSVWLEAAIPGPFAGDTADIDRTVDYSRIVRFILERLDGQGPFPSPEAAARAVARFVFAEDERIRSVRVALSGREGGGPAATVELSLERDHA